MRDFSEMIIKLPNEALLLIDQLINHWNWDYYDRLEEENLQVTVPSLVADPTRGDNLEQSIFKQLQSILKKEDFFNLSIIIKERRSDILSKKFLEEKHKKEEEQKRLEQENKNKQKELNPSFLSSCPLSRRN